MSRRSVAVASCHTSQAKPRFSEPGRPFVWENGRRDHRPRSRARPAHRAHRARRARRARADGGHHQHRLPAAVPRVRRGAVRQRDDHVARARRAQRHDDAPHHPPRVRDAALDPAVRRRPRHRRGRRARARRRGPRRPHRPELRMPRAQGHAQGRRSRAAVEARAVPRHRHARRRAPRATSRSPIKMRKGIDADHLTYLDAGRIAEDAGVAAVALHARTAAEFYSARPTGRRSPSSRRPSRACPCSATATSGRPTTPCA